MTKHPIRILLVDDDQMILRLMQHILSSNFGDDLQIVSTSNPGEALTINSHGGIDICITDLDMPSFNGFNILKAIKSVDSLTEVIILTSSPSSNAIRSAFAMGANDYLVKPIHESVLIDTVKFYMARINRFRNEILKTDLVSERN